MENVVTKVLRGMWALVKRRFVPCTMNAGADRTRQATRQLLIGPIVDNQFTLESDLRLRCAGPEGNSRV
ncbi:hypothetical protein NLM27_27080 [Bradyrhizobium sp. CCGB12]|uniref:hypothetical protein n=1 Tax=Bradyrhizobium sp. CCGB12 TaxID=2949632 RepID=UPI0020B30BD5|nr:hypothetical protein [Bradyrhizobium sp. CCGB12]MCP3392414.1 hypothetical protein [Bradyrhizobium sp. CCGB12]